MNATAKAVLTKIFVVHSPNPFRSKSFTAALAIAIVSCGLWLKNRQTGPSDPQRLSTPTDRSQPLGAVANLPLPGYGKVAGSYAAGFLIGLGFRRVLKRAALVTALLIGVVGLGRYAGCDTRKAEEEVKKGEAWVQKGVAKGKDYLQGLLPSASAGGFGVLLGFRRRGPKGEEPVVTKVR